MTCENGVIRALRAEEQQALFRSFADPSPDTDAPEQASPHIQQGQEAETNEGN